jgi:predicted Zn-dependent protease
MNSGDLAVEKNNMQLAMNEYNAAMKLFPGNLEMKYWTAITLANNKQVDQSDSHVESHLCKRQELERTYTPAAACWIANGKLHLQMNLQRS